MTSKVCVVSGNRSDGGLLEPLVDRLKCPHIKMWGELPDLEVQPNSDTPIGTCTSQALVLLRLPPLLTSYDSVVILGDRFEALAASLVAYNMGKAIYHLQGSDCTLESLDDGYRQCIRTLATQHFDIEEYGSLGCVFPEIPDIDFPVGFVFCFHPYKGPWLEDLVETLKIIKHIPNGFYMTSNTDAGGRQINKVLEAFGHVSMERGDYLKLLKKARFIIGNSSSGIIEAPSLGVPTINIGGRQRGRCRAASVIDCEAKEIPEALGLIKKIDWSKVDNPYYKPDTVERIAKVIENN